MLVIRIIPRHLGKVSGIDLIYFLNKPHPIPVGLYGIVRFHDPGNELDFAGRIFYLTTVGYKEKP
jgi:hypothetical protein